MELLPGETLLPLLKQLPLPAGQVAELGAKVADALQALHGQGVVHLDVKPSNIISGPPARPCSSTTASPITGALPDLMQEEFRCPTARRPTWRPSR